MLALVSLAHRMRCFINKRAHNPHSSPSRCYSIWQGQRVYGITNWRTQCQASQSTSPRVSHPFSASFLKQPSFSGNAQSPAPYLRGSRSRVCTDYRDKSDSSSSNRMQSMLRRRVMHALHRGPLSRFSHSHHSLMRNLIHINDHLRSLSNDARRPVLSKTLTPATAADSRP